MANTHQVLEGVKEYALDLLGTEFRDVAVDAAGRSESAATRSEGAAENAAKDAAATSADRVATGEDRTQTGKDAEVSQEWADSSTTSAALSLVAAATVTQFVGDGFPEGKVAAPVGSIYVDRLATSGAIRWIKTSATGNTGWRVEYGDTGWRSVTPDRTRVPSGEMRFRRQGNTVTVRLVGMVHESPLSALQNLGLAIPLHFRPIENQVFGLVGNTGSLRSHVFTIFNRQVPYIQRNGIYADLPEVDGGYDGQISYVTNDTWPSALPGTPS